MKLRIFSKVKLFWPLGAFAFAALLVVVLLSTQANKKSALSAEEIRRGRYEATLQKARWFFDRLEYIEACETFERIGKDYRDMLEPDVHLEIARAVYCYRPNRTDTINSHLNEFLTYYNGSPKERQADALRGEMLNREGKFTEALALLERVTNQETGRLEEHAHVYMEMGRAYYRLKNYPKAETWLDEVLRYSRNARDIAQAHFLLGETHVYTAVGGSKRLRKAIEYFDRVKSDDQYPGLRYAARVRIADALLSLEEYDKAREAYLWALDVVPSEAGMKEYLPEYGEIGQEALKLAQVIGEKATKTTGGTKLERVVEHYIAKSEEKKAGELLVVMAGKVKENGRYFMRAAIQFKVKADSLLADIEKLRAVVAQRSNRLHGLTGEDALVHMRKTIAEKENQRRILLALAARNYVSAYDAEPYDRYGDSNPLDHPLWKAATIHCERKAYASAKDVLSRIIDDTLMFKPVLTLNAYLALGDVYRIEGEYDLALKMYGFVTNYQVGGKDNAMARNDFRGRALLRRALTLLDAGRYDRAEKGLNELLGPDGERYGLFSKIYWEASFALGRLTYYRATTAETGRMEAFLDAAGKLRESLEFYRGIADAQTTEQARFCLAASLHLAGIEALRSERKVVAAGLFVEARGVFERIASRDVSDRDAENVIYRIGRLLYADTFFFEARLSQDNAEREDLFRRAVSEYGAVADAFQDTEQGGWARVQMAVVYQLLGEGKEADRQFDMAVAVFDKIDRSARGDADRLSKAYFKKQIEWFRKTKAKLR